MRKIYVTNEDLGSKTLNELLSSGEYFSVKLRRRDGLEFIGHFAKYHHEDRVYFISDDPAFDGSEHTELKDHFDMVCSWSCYSVPYAERLVNDSGAAYDYIFLGVYDDGTKPAQSESEECWEFVNNNYRTGIYSGIQDYHYYHDVEFNEPIAETKGYRIGVELEVECNDERTTSKFDSKFESNWLMMETDGSLRRGLGIEFITIPMLPKHIKAKNTWFDFISFMSTRATSWSTDTCGLHVHIGREILGKTAETQSETIGKLLYLYHHFLKDHDINIKIYGRERGYNDHDGKVREGDAVKLLGKDVLSLESVKDKLKTQLTRQSMRDRYFDINLRNTHTIEFRKGRGSLNVDRIISVIEYSELMCKYARTASWTDMSVEDFFAFVRKNIKSSSPLQRYFGYEMDV
jgi:hypothetical protein